MQNGQNEEASPPRSLEAWREEVRRTMARGELLQAYDLSEQALASFPDDAALLYTSVLTLARAGAIRQARSRYDTSHLAELADKSTDREFQVDVGALDARIAKDEALATHDRERRPRLRDAALRYEAIFRRIRGYYPGINAATLHLVSGDSGRAESIAREVLSACSSMRGQRNSDAYYLAATEAEASLVLGDAEGARTALSAAASAGTGDLSAFATTRRQLKLICAARDIPTELLSPLRVPTVIHYTGHRAGKRFPQSEESRVRTQIAAALERHQVGFGYGSLAAGSDILFAEELLRRGAEVNVALPFNIEEFKQISVAPQDSPWLKRFDSCLAAAKAVTFATTDEYLGDDSLFAYTSRMAMGLALLRARFLDADVCQIAVWDGGPAGGRLSSVGTAADVTFWQSRNLESEIVNPLDGKGSGKTRRAVRAPSGHEPQRKGRSIRAMLFGDVKGFSKLREAQLPVFEREVLGRFARVLERHRRRILFRNTWGDGLYVVAADVETAARCATDLQEEMTSFAPAKHGLPESMALRLGGHLGPVFRMRDPVLKRWNFIGAHVSRTARIEPITPEGGVYVTEAFAAALATDREHRFVCEYVGQVPAAKHYGTMRMYSLRRSK